MDIDSEAVRPILERIAVRGEDDGEKFTNTARVDAIASCLKESGWEPYHDGDLAKIYVQRDFDLSKPVVVVSSHVDMVAERCYAKCDGEYPHMVSLSDTHKVVCYRYYEEGEVDYNDRNDGGDK